MQQKTTVGRSGRDSRLVIKIVWKSANVIVTIQVTLRPVVAMWTYMVSKRKVWNVEATSAQVNISHKLVIAEITQRLLIDWFKTAFRANFLPCNQ